MNLNFAILVGLVLAGSEPGPAAAPPSPGQPPATLRWQNGETLPGQILEGSAADVKWKTPLFEDPLQLRWEAIRRIDQPLGSVSAPDPLSISLRDGSHIYGSLVSMTDTNISIHSERHGDATLKRAEVLEMRKIRGDGVVLGGLEGDVGWASGARKTGNPPRKANTNNLNNVIVAGKVGTVQLTARQTEEIPSIATGPGGALRMPYWNRSAVLDLALPARVEIEFRVRSSVRPDFRFSFQGEPEQQLRVETWDDELVLAVANQFKSIRKIADNDREVALRIFWDRALRKCSVYTPAGELITQWDFPDDSQTSNGGLELQNKGRDLSLELLKVRAWDGAPPPKVNGKGPRVEMADGRVIEGEIVQATAEALDVREAGKDAPTSVPLANVAAMIFSTDAPKLREAEATLSYADGTLIAGRISSIKDGNAAIETSFSEAPLKSQMTVLRQMRFRPPAADAPPATPLAELDKLVIQGTTLHGKFVSGGDDRPRWMPVGGVGAALPSKALATEISRAFPPDAKPGSASALFYTSAGDVIPGTLRGIDRSGVELESNLVEVTKLPAESLDAIQFDAVPQTGLNGFADPGWRVLKGDKESVKREGDTLVMKPETSIAHSMIMQSSEIKFSVTSTNFSCIRLKMFCAGTDGAKATNLLLGNTGNEFYSGLESAEGQFLNQVQTAITPGQPISVRLVIGDKFVDFHVNGVLSQKFPIDPSKRAGAGLIIEPAGMWGNNVTPVWLKAISAVFGPGRAWLPDVSADTRKQTLTVPRFRRDDPPRHALLGPNGDVLRGEIEAATATHFGFRSGLENLRVPLSRVKAVIWLKKPEAEGASPAAVASNPTMKALDQKIERRVNYGSAPLSTYISLFKREAPDLKFKLPEKDDGRRYPMQFGGQTIGEALDRVCSLFSLRYRIDADGTIILESGPKALKDLVQKVYWLKAGAIPITPSAKELLSGKGISFPSGASVEWRANGAQLSMTNNAANQEKLVEVLNADFGGIVGSPTHWLQLTNGARLALAVDRFEKGFILGHHPIYGRCKAAISDVYAIRTSAPERSIAMKSVEDWRLVYAPEPVLPETGGESSPTLGKEAKTFKLGMLAGGDFDLSQEKGKVIVLDFWATWCGPCVKSLPSLIEAMSAFPEDRVKLIGVNQGEPADLVKRFLETRNWKLNVAMDVQQSVAHQYGVDGIPHTVIVGPDGKVAWVKTGYSPDGDTEAANAVKQLLGEAPPAEAPAK